MKASQVEGVPPFYCGYAYEALAHAEYQAGNTDKMKEYIRDGRRMAIRITDLQEKQQLEDDLDSIG